MKINYMDGGMIYEINKKYNDCGEYAIEHDKSLLRSIYSSYINNGSKFITTPNYCLKPNYTKNWEHLLNECICITNEFRKSAYILGSLPPFNKSYSRNIIDDSFIEFYEKTIKLFKNNVDYYLIETAYCYEEINKIYEIINKIDCNTPIILSLYPNKNHIKHIDDYMKMNLYGIFLNCCKVDEMIEFYENFFESKNFNETKFGFYCNKIDEKNYSKSHDLKNLQKYYLDKEVNYEKLKSFLKKFNNQEIFIGGCCGYGIDEMKELIESIQQF